MCYNHCIGKERLYRHHCEYWTQRSRSGEPRQFQSKNESFVSTLSRETQIRFLSSIVRSGEVWASSAFLGSPTSSSSPSCPFFSFYLRGLAWVWWGNFWAISYRRASELNFCRYRLRWGERQNGHEKEKRQALETTTKVQEKIKRCTIPMDQWRTLYKGFWDFLQGDE